MYLLKHAHKSLLFYICVFKTFLMAHIAKKARNTHLNIGTVTPVHFMHSGLITWKRLMSRGFPAFFRQFWLHFRKNLRKNLQLQKDRARLKSQYSCWLNICESLKVQCESFGKNTKRPTRDAWTIPNPHPSSDCDKYCFLCKNNFKTVKKRLPCKSISKLLSRPAINSPVQM